ncbi:MAG TPA: hypothetical protein VF220_01535 [Nitrososphaeraceae archaeon]
MIPSKKQKLIKSLKTLKETQVTQEYNYVDYGPKKEKLYCFNAWMYKSLYPKTSFNALINKSVGTISKALTEELMENTNITHYEYINKMIDFKTAIKMITEEINSN